MPAANHTRIPLDSLFAQLRAEGFEINTATILDIQKVLANLDEDDVADINTLPSLLGPLICRNKEEQEKFYVICKKYFESVSREMVIEKPPKQPAKRRKIIILSIGLLLIAAITVYLYNKYKHVPFATTQITNTRNNTEFVVNDTITFKVIWADSADNNRFNYTWTIGDSTYQQQVVKKIFTKAGTFKENHAITYKNGDAFSGSDGEIFISCEPKPSVEIVKEQSNTSSEKIYRAVITNPGKGPYYYLWKLNNKFVSGQKDYYSEYSSDSAYTIQLIVRFEKLVHCSTDSLTASLTETPEIAMAVTGTNPITISRTIHPGNLLWIISGLLIFPSLVSIAVYRLIKKTKKEKEQREAEERKKKEQEFLRRQMELTGEEKKYTGPYSIEFASQNDKICAETGISQLAETLRKRHSSDNYHLDVYKTIRQTIKSGGFPSLQFTPKTQPTDFLILLDNEYPDGHLTRLFSWVIGKLKKEEVQFTAYSFYKEPLLLNNESLSHHLLPLDKLARLYPESIVLIFSTANGFFESYRPVVKNWIKQKFRNWETKLIITPVTKNDWGSKELALYEAGFTVVPADINAHQVITDEINFMIDKQKLKKKIVPGAYAARQHNFNRWNQLENYLTKASDEIQKTTNSFPGGQLLQKWVCALAVYPHINWNITLAIGKALEEKYCKPGQLVNYTNLLALSRIGWMNDGQVSDALKKEMLVHLDKGSEAIARSAVAKALREIEPSINSNSLVSDEFIYLKTTNQFLLHTYNEKENGLTQQEHLRMKDYVEGNQLDWVLDEYLSTASNKSLLLQPGTTTSITPEKYFELYNDRDKAYIKQEDAFKAEQERKRRLMEQRQKWIDRFKVAALFLALAIPAFFILRGQKVFAGLYSTKTSTIHITMEPNSTYASLKDFSIVLNADSSYNANILSDSNAVIDNIALSKIPSAANLIFSRGASSYRQSLDTIYSSYTIHFREKGALPRLLVRYNKMTDEFNRTLKTLSASYNVSYLQQDETDSNRIIYYNPESKQRADSIAKIVWQTLAISIPIIYIPENREPPAPPMLFLKVSENNVVATKCNEITSDILPSTLQEIWSANADSRFINIAITSNLLFYAPKDQDNYTSFDIEKTCQINNGYKLIVKEGNNYKIFLIRNVQQTSFELAVCNDAFSKIEDAESVTGCGDFYRMNLYYPKNPDLIYVPANLTNYVSSEMAKFKLIMGPQSTVARGSAVIDSVTININLANLFPDGSGRNDKIRVKSELFKIRDRKIKWIKGGNKSKNPFDRDYLRVVVKPIKGPDCTVTYYSMFDARAVSPSLICQLDISKESLTNIPKELYTFINMQQLNLGSTSIKESEIQKLQKALPKCKITYQLKIDQPTDNTYYFIAALKFDEKDNPTSAQQYFLQKLGEYLRNYPAARVGIDLKYSRGMNSNRENAMLNMTRNILEKAGASPNQISKMSGKEEIQQEQQQQQQQQQLNAYPTPSQDVDRVLIYVSGIDDAGRRILRGYLNPKSAN